MSNSMIWIRHCCWITVFSLMMCFRCYADPLLQEDNVGRYYGLVRAQLMKAGDIPIRQDNLQYNCDTVEDVCSLYPEEMDCGINAIDKPVICAFEWKSKRGQRYSITTAGEDPHKLIITEIGLTPRSLLKKGLSNKTVEPIAAH